MSTVYSFEKGDYPESGKDIFLYFKDQSGKERLDSIAAYVNDEGEIRTSVPFTDEALYFSYKDDLEWPLDRVENFVSLTIHEFSTTSDGDDEDYELGIFRHAPTYQELRSYIKERFDGRLKHITEVTPKLSTLQILDETLHNVSVYGDFTVDIKGMLYHGTIELYEIGEWN